MEPITDGDDCFMSIARSSAFQEPREDVTLVGIWKVIVETLAKHVRRANRDSGLSTARCSIIENGVSNYKRKQIAAMPERHGYIPLISPH